jgi:hypothetical protein
VEAAGRRRSLLGLTARVPFQLGKVGGTFSSGGRLAAAAQGFTRVVARVEECAPGTTKAVTPGKKESARREQQRFVVVPGGKGGVSRTGIVVGRIKESSSRRRRSRRESGPYPSRNRRAPPGTTRRAAPGQHYYYRSPAGGSFSEMEERSFEELNEHKSFESLSLGVCSCIKKQEAARPRGQQKRGRPRGQRSRSRPGDNKGCGPGDKKGGVFRDKKQQSSTDNKITRKG